MSSVRALGMHINLKYLCANQLTMCVNHKVASSSLRAPVCFLDSQHEDRVQGILPLSLPFLLFPRPFVRMLLADTKGWQQFSNLLGTVYCKGNILFTPDGTCLLSPVGNRITVFDLIKYVARPPQRPAMMQSLRRKSSVTSPTPSPFRIAEISPA